MADIYDFATFERVVTTIEETNGRLKSGHGGGTSGGMSDDWKKSVEDQLGKLHADFCLLLQWGAGAVVLIVILIAGLYVRTDEKFEKVGERIAALETKVEGMDARLNSKLDRLLERGADMPSK